MNIGVFKDVILGGLLSYAALSFLARLYLYYRRKKKETQVLFITNESLACRVEHTSNSSPCNNPSCAFAVIGTVINCIEKTTESLEVCIHSVTYFDLADAILKVRRKGKSVRVITDADASVFSQSQIKHLRRGGIPVRMESPFHMNHSFFIVDGKILVTGSFSWTIEDMTGNWNYVKITSSPNLVQRYKSYFNELWNKFSDLAGIVTVLFKKETDIFLK